MRDRDVVLALDDDGACLTRAVVIELGAKKTLEPCRVEIGAECVVDTHKAATALDIDAQSHHAQAGHGIAAGVEEYDGIIGAKTESAFEIGGVLAGGNLVALSLEQFSERLDARIAVVMRVHARSDVREDKDLPGLFVTRCTVIPGVVAAIVDAAAKAVFLERRVLLGLLRQNGHGGQGGQHRGGAGKARD